MIDSVIQNESALWSGITHLSGLLGIVITSIRSRHRRAIDSIFFFPSYRSLPTAAPIRSQARWRSMRSPMVASANHNQLRRADSLVLCFINAP